MRLSAALLAVADFGSVIDAFRATMLARGLDIRGTIHADGVLHRAHVEGDRSHTESAWYILHCDDHPNGAFGCWKRYGREKFSWSSHEANDWTPEQKREWRAKMDRQRLERERADQERHAAAAERAEAIWAAAEPAEDNHPYLNRKGCKSHDIRVGTWDIVSTKTGEISNVSNLALLIPIRDTRKKIWSLQAIFPTDRNILKRDKDYLKDGAKLGLFFTIGKPRDETILICEGYATGASLHESTDHAVVVAFDTSNLEPTASALRICFPQHRLVFCADNDRWTEKPVPNPGVHYAEAAATVVGGIVAIPRFMKPTESKLTDFNDLAKHEGPEAVARIIEKAIAESMAPDPDDDNEPPPPADLAPQESIEKESHEVVTTDTRDVVIDPAPENDVKENVSGIQDYLLKNPFFEILGYEHSSYFFFHKGKRQIMQYERGEFSESTFIELASPALFWEQHFRGGSKKVGFDKTMATNFIMRAAEWRGIYDPDRIRGRGAWFDNGRMVYHHGGRLTVDGEGVEIGDFRTRFIYELQRELPDPDPVPLSDEDGDRLISLAGSFRWTKPASAALLCGWIMLAPICGALKWRPHVWLSGGAGSGKSTLLNEFVHPLLNGADIFAQGNTTEAGLRQKLRTDALPVLFEESESNEDKDRMRMQHVLSLIRQSSTETLARTYKGTIGGHSMEFLIRSMFCLASIQVGIKHQADVERVTILSLRPKKEKDRNGMEDWKALENRMYEVVGRDRTIGARLVRRSMSMLPIIQQNVNTFATAAGSAFGSAREGDQYGTLLAGAWSLFNSQAATPEDAKAMIESYIWEEHRDTADTDESEQALAALMGSRLRAPRGLEYTIHELAAAACGKPIPGAEVDRSDATTILKRYGMVIKDDFLMLSNSSQELRNIMAGTNFAADWRGVLLRIPGTDRNENKPIKFNGVLSKCIRIPMSPILTDIEGAQRGWLEADNPVERP